MPNLHPPRKSFSRAEFPSIKTPCHLSGGEARPLHALLAPADMGYLASCVNAPPRPLPDLALRRSSPPCFVRETFPLLPFCVISLLRFAPTNPKRTIAIMTKFTDLGLSPLALDAVDALGYTDPTPVQEQAIPAVLAGRDIIAAASRHIPVTNWYSLARLLVCGLVELA